MRKSVEAGIVTAMDLDLISQARERISRYLEPSPLIRATSPSLVKPFGGNIYLKLETLQPTGSFKIRPALNGILSNLSAARSRGVLASSSGNFAQAVAYASSLLGCSAMIVMTEDTSTVKIERTRKLGAEVVLCPPTFKDRWDTTFRLERETGRLLLHPYDSDETIAGNATIGLELHDQLPAGAFHVIVPVSGGGLIAGIATAVKQLRPDAKIFGAQPATNGSMKHSLAKGARVTVSPAKSVADALVALTPGEKAFSIAMRHLEDVVLVSDDDVMEALKILTLEQRLITEPAGAVSVAAALKIAAQTGHRATPCVCILSGGNISFESLASQMLN